MSNGKLFLFVKLTALLINLDILIINPFAFDGITELNTERSLIKPIFCISKFTLYFKILAGRTRSIYTFVKKNQNVASLKTLSLLLIGSV